MLLILRYICTEIEGAYSMKLRRVSPEDTVNIAASSEGPQQIDFCWLYSPPMDRIVFATSDSRSPKVALAFDGALLLYDPQSGPMERRYKIKCRRVMLQPVTELIFCIESTNKTNIF